MNIYLDFETYYDQEYGLKTHSIEAYVRDPRFEPLLLTVAIDDGAVWAFPPEKIAAALARLPLGDPNTYTFAHNAKFDIFIIEHWYGIRVANPVCTYGLARFAGVSRVCSESLAALAQALGLGKKETHVRAGMLGKRPADLSPAELREFWDYGRHDTYLLRGLTQKLRAMIGEGEHLDDALAFIALTTKMYTQPRLRLDRPLLAAYHETLASRIEDERQKLLRWFNFPDVAAFLKGIRSAATLTKMLQALGVEVPLKISTKRTKTARAKVEDQGGDPSTVADIWIPALAKGDLEFVALRAHPDVRVGALVDARLGNNTSITMSRCETFLAASTRGPVPVPLEPYGARTGRYAAGTGDEVRTDAFNFQNLGKRQGDKTLRRCVQAPPGYTLVAADSAQVEARVGAWLAGEEALVSAFREGTDPYCQFAGVIYNQDQDLLRGRAKGLLACSDQERAEAVYRRDVGKEGILSSQYYVGYRTFGLRLLQRGIRLAPDDAGHYEESQRINRLYRATYKAIVNMWRLCETVLNCMMDGQAGTFAGPDGHTLRYNGRVEYPGHTCGVIYLPDGYPLVYADLRKKYDTERKRWVTVYSRRVGKTMQDVSIYGGMLFENITQALAFAAMRYQIVRAYRPTVNAPAVLNSHDEWAVLALTEDVSLVQAALAQAMRTAPPWGQGIPFDCDPPSAGANYGEV